SRPSATARATSGSAGATNSRCWSSSPRCWSLSSSRSESFFATCPRGLESLLVQELDALDISASAVPGGVAFSGPWEACYRANLWSRLASRILWRVAQFEYRNEDDLYAAVKAIDWPRYFRVERTLRVNVTAQKSPLKSLEFATLRIKDAVCDRFRDASSRRPDVERSNPDIRVHAFLEGARGTLYLDTSGEPLFQPAWRAAPASRRHLAAAGVERWVQLEQADVLGRSAPAPAGVMVMNPPYGERMGSEQELARFYPELGDALKKKFAGWRCHVFTADLRL